MVSDMEKALEDINKQPKDQEIYINISKYEKEYMESISGLLSKLKVTTPDKQEVNIIKENSLAEFIRYCISFTCNTYQVQFFPDSRLIERFENKKAMKEFIAFRQKYMNIPIDAQLNELKGLGIVKQKQK